MIWKWLYNEEIKSGRFLYYNKCESCGKFSSTTSKVCPSCGGRVSGCIGALVYRHINILGLLWSKKIVGFKQKEGADSFLYFDKEKLTEF